MPVTGQRVVRRTLGRRLPRLRLANGKTRREVAEAKFGISEPTLHRIETGKVPVTPANVRALCWLYGATIRTGDGATRAVRVDGESLVDLGLADIGELLDQPDWVEHATRAGDTVEAVGCAPQSGSTTGPVVRSASLPSARAWRNSPGLGTLETGLRYPCQPRECDVERPVVHPGAR
ncbi:helix-turn-helix transcriptional regulator [Micromonospora sp. NPDC050495]|uniref:helix-turn-helix domain-containing protein n=1 Tax=Micromonospora sp. NPDC050495 TaxID=3154936 RepID=UPI0033E12088